MNSLNRAFKSIFECDINLIEGPEPEIQKEIDHERRLREVKNPLHRVGDSRTETPPVYDGVLAVREIKRGNP